MNKKIRLAVLTALSISLPLFGCGNKAIENDNKQQIEQNESVQSETKNVDYSESYAPVLSKYRDFVKDCSEGTLDNEKYPNEALSSLSKENKEYMMSLVTSDKCGYAFKDLNSNGIDELLFLIKINDNDDYLIGAIYSLVDNKPTLLKSFFSGGPCYIGKDGFIYRHNRMRNPWNESYEKCTINYDGTDFKALERFESQSFDENTNESMQDKDGKALVKYYHTQEDGKRNEISKQEYDELFSQIPRDNKQSGLDFIKLTE